MVLLRALAPSDAAEHLTRAGAQLVIDPAGIRHAYGLGGLESPAAGVMAFASATVGSQAKELASAA